MPAAGGRGEEETRIQQESTSCRFQTHTLTQIKSYCMCLLSTLLNTKRLHHRNKYTLTNTLFTEFKHNFLIFSHNSKVLLRPLQYSRCVIALATVATVLLTTMVLYNLLTPRVPSSHPAPSSSLRLPQGESCSDPCK